MLRKKTISARLAAKVLNLTGHTGGEALFRKKIGSALRVPDEFGHLAVRRTFPAPGPRVFYQIRQELVKHDGEKEKNGKSYHESRRPLPQTISLAGTAGTPWQSLL
jgi:hypothetical protein